MRPNAARHSREKRGEVEFATSLLERSLEGVPTVWGKLVRISAFRVPGSDEYAHPDLARIVRPVAAAKAARQVHEHVFRDWLGLGLREQYKELAEYVERAGEAGGSKPSEGWEGLVPPTASAADRALFETDLAIVLELTEERSSSAS